MSDVLVHNYHYWSNIVVAEMVRIFHLPALFVQFQFSTVLISVLLGCNAVVFGQILGISKKFVRWLVFLFYFGSDLVFYILLILGRNITQITKISSLEDGSIFLINPPRAFSHVIALAGLALITLWF